MIFHLIKDYLSGYPFEIFFNVLIHFSFCFLSDRKSNKYYKQQFFHTRKHLFTLLCYFSLFYLINRYEKCFGDTKYIYYLK
jgi:uncharacterized membrane protein